MYYFGRWGRMVNGKRERLPDDGWQHALALYQAQRDALYADRKPRTTDNAEGTTVRELCNRFLTAKTRKIDAGKLSVRVVADYREGTDILIAPLGKDRPADDIAAADFEEMLGSMSKRWGLVRRGNFVTRVKFDFRTF